MRAALGRGGGRNPPGQMSGAGVVVHPSRRQGHAMRIGQQQRAGCAVHGQRPDAIAAGGGSHRPDHRGHGCPPQFRILAQTTGNLHRCRQRGRGRRSHRADSVDRHAAHARRADVDPQMQRIAVGQAAPPLMVRRKLGGAVRRLKLYRRSPIRRSGCSPASKATTPPGRSHRSRPPNCWAMLASLSAMAA